MNTHPYVNFICTSYFCSAPTERRLNMISTELPKSGSYGAGIYPNLDVPINQSIIHSFSQSFNQSISQSVNQSISQSVNQSISQSINQSVNQSISQNSLFNIESTPKSLIKKHNLAEAQFISHLNCPGLKAGQLTINRLHYYNIRSDTFRSGLNIRHSFIPLHTRFLK